MIMTDQEYIWPEDLGHDVGIDDLWPMFGNLYRRYSLPSVLFGVVVVQERLYSTVWV